MRAEELTPDTKIRIRPSSVSSYLHCNRKWAATFLDGYRGWGSFATTRGTAVHAAGEQIWTESIKANKKIINITAAKDAAAQSVDDRFQAEEIRLDDDKFETKDGCKDSAVEGAEAYCNLAEQIEIPAYTEKFFSVDTGDNIEIAGTSDYISKDGIVQDIKTSSKKSTPQQHVAQLSVYARLAQLNGIEVNTTDSVIQNIAFTKKATTGYILPFKLDLDLSSYLINTIRERIILTRINPLELDLLFPANPSSYLCSPKYCAYWDDCDAVAGKRKIL